MLINAKKTKEILIDFAKKPAPIPELIINGQKIERVTSSKLLGVVISDNLSWGEHINYIVGRATQRLFFLRLLKRANVSMDKMIEVFCTIIRPTVEYACQVWHGTLTDDQSKAIESIQERALKIIMPDANYDLAREIAELPKLSERRRSLCLKLFIEVQNPDHRLHHLLPNVKESTHNLRSGQKYPRPKVTTDRAKYCFINWCIYKLQ